MDEEKKETKNNEWEDKYYTVVGGILLVVAAVAGYKYGYRRHGRQFDRGYARICKVDPTLNEHFIDAINMYRKSQLMKKK